MDPNPARPWQRMPKWLKVTLGVFAILFVTGAIFGKSAPAPAPTAAAPASTPPPTTSVPVAAAPSSTVPPPAYTVESVTDGATVVVVGTDGSRRTVHILGITVPTGSNCYGTETLAWATQKLGSAAVQMTTSTEGVALTLADGTDYATNALQTGHAVLATASSTALSAAESAAKQATTGLWAEPCKGMITGPTPQPPAPPAPPAPPPAPPATHEDPPQPPAEESKPDTKPNRTYKNCTEARAAGVTPLYAGEPGYSRKLDRDGDGVACE